MPHQVLGMEAQLHPVLGMSCYGAFPYALAAVTYVLLLGLVCGRNLSRRIRFLPEAPLIHLRGLTIALFCSIPITHDLQHSDTPLLHKAPVRSA